MSTPATLRVEPAWPFGWAWRFTGGPDRGRWSTAGWALTRSRAERDGFKFIGRVESATATTIHHITERTYR